MDGLLNFLIGALLSPVLAFALHLLARRSSVRFSFFAAWWGGAGVPMVVNSVAGNWGIADWEATSLGVGIAAWLWWRRRRKDRAPRAYGAKSRALIAALVAKAREATKPRPVLRPAPGGAR